jgi:predicted metal-binding membrane protein
MRGMVMGLGHIGVRAHGEMGAAIFLAMWMTMMAAMMLPTVAPMVLAHLAVTRRRGRAATTVVFVAGYLLAWFAIGVVPLAAYAAFSLIPENAAWLPALSGAILMITGAYQFTGWKQVCLDKCQTPFAFIAQHDFEGGATSALRAGIVHGAYCMGCCWALTVVFLVVGLMNLIWMAAIFALFLIEKSWRRGLAMARVAGAALIMLGAIVIVYPGVLPAISS